MYVYEYCYVGHNMLSMAKKTEVEIKRESEKKYSMCVFRERERERGNR